MWYIHPTEYYSARNKIHATTGINFENMMLCERNQAQKATYGMIPFM